MATTKKLNKKEVKHTEASEEFTASRPDYKGDGVAVWINKDRKGNDYLTIKLLGSLTVRAFPVKEAS